MVDNTQTHQKVALFYHHLSRGFLNFKQWKMIAQNMNPEELIQRLNKYFDLTLSVSGFTAGFTYLNSNSDLKFNKQGFMTPDERSNLYFLLVFLSFLLFISSSLLSALLSG